MFVAVGAAAMRGRGQIGAAGAVVAFVAVVGAGLATSHRSGLSIALSALGVTAFYIMSLFARRLREGQEQAERLLVELEESRAAQAQAAALGERQRLAREMHDVLAHSLSGLVLQLEGARLLAAQRPEGSIRSSSRRSSAAHHLAKAGLEEARRAIGMLRGDELPGPERLDALAREFERDCAVPCRLEIRGVERDLGSDARLTVYRVAQEALTNVRKHADARAGRAAAGIRACGHAAGDRGLRPERRRAARRCRRRIRADRDAGARGASGRHARGGRHRARVPGRAVGAVVTAIRVLLADDQRVVREGLAMLLQLLPGVEVVGSASDGDEAVALAGRLHPDVVLMDLGMPHCDGVEATRRLRECQPGVKVIVLTTYADDRSVVEALRAGARGFLTKDAGADQIEQALQAVARGEAAIDPAVQHHVVAAVADTASAADPPPPAAPRRAHAARGRGRLADRRRPEQQRDRRPPGDHRGDRQEPHQPPLHEDRRARPRPGGHLRVPARPRTRCVRPC